MEGEGVRAHKAFRELGKSLKSLPSDPAPKDVHKLRTATRRVEAIASALPTDRKKTQRLLKSIAMVRKAAGSVRDMDVLAANACKLARYASGDSLTRLIEFLECARQQNAGELCDTLHRQRKSARGELKDYARRVKAELNGASTNGQNGQPHEELHTMAVNVVRELGEWPLLDTSNIHEFRLKVKELRYILQLYSAPESELVQSLWNVQRHIGDWHDWQQLSEIAHEVLRLERDLPLLARIDQTAKRKFDLALKAANSLRGKYLTVPIVMGA